MKINEWTLGLAALGTISLASVAQAAEVDLATGTDCDPALPEPDFFAQVEHIEKSDPNKTAQ